LIPVTSHAVFPLYEEALSDTWSFLAFGIDKVFIPGKQAVIRTLRRRQEETALAADEHHLRGDSVGTMLMDPHAGSQLLSRIVVTLSERVGRDDTIKLMAEVSRSLPYMIQLWFTLQSQGQFEEHVYNERYVALPYFYAAALMVASGRIWEGCSGSQPDELESVLKQFRFHLPSLRNMRDKLEELAR
jgi:hypothetical protein